jgi:hypothetical protein
VFAKRIAAPSGGVSVPGAAPPGAPGLGRGGDGIRWPVNLGVMIAQVAMLNDISGPACKFRSVGDSVRLALGPYPLPHLQQLYVVDQRGPGEISPLPLAPYAMPSRLSSTRLV